MALPPHLRFSQASLQDYVDCPRRFQLRYLLNTRWPTAHESPIAEWERRSQRGATFHRMIHQHTVGISAEEIETTIDDDEVLGWWRAYIRTPPRDLPTTTRRSEVRLSTPLAGYRLLARYDLIAIEPEERAVIVDWKTSQKRPLRSWLQERQQTSVYRYVLVQAGTGLNNGKPFVPEQITLLYWFARFPLQIERFDYDTDQHDAIEAALSETIARISETKDEEWMLTDDLRHCKYCAYRMLCERQEVEEAERVDLDPEEDLFDFDLEQIAEIEF
jgi:CRISPR/Cas system-associated exonuclease Cas4 (RecB family)